MKYRRIVPVDARQVPPLTPGWHEFPPLSLDEIAEWCGGQPFVNAQRGAYIAVPRLEGDPRAWPSNWIVEDASGQFHKVEHEDFATNFRPVPEAGTHPELAARRLAEAKAVLAGFRREDADFIADGTPMPNYSQWACRLATQLSDLIATLEQEQS